jgi:predicted dehydrogenase
MAWNVGVLGLTHDHVWEHIGTLAQRPDVRLSVADPNTPLVEKVRDEYGVERGYSDYAALLERERPDAVLVFADNAGSVDIVEMAASHGTPVMLEKPMADALAGAERIRVAVNKAAVPLMVNWPTNWTPAVRHALDLAAGGAVGDIFRFSFRGGHGGPKEYGCSEYFYSWLYDRERNGAGAYIDYCGYGAVMARQLLGRPARAQATIGRLQKDYVPVDDNAILVLRYPQAMAVIEATWTANGPVPDGGPAIWGSEGSLVVQRQSARREGQIVRTGVVKRTSRDDPDGEMIEPPDLPEGARNATEYFLNCLANDRPFEGLVSLDISLGAQEILEAGLIAARAGSEVSLPLDICNWG